MAAKPASRPGRSPRQVKQPQHPALRAALQFLAPVVILRLVSSVVAPGIWWLAIFGIIYVLNGYVAGKYHAESTRHVSYRHGSRDRASQGAGAGILLSLLSWVGFTIAAVVLQLVSVPFSWGGAELLVVLGPLDFILALLLGAFGASRYR